jgi:hypothetical protein
MTSEFLIWSLEYPCPPRGLLDGTDPELVERSLRAARAFSDARAAGHLFEGWCVQPPLAFRPDEALTLYGGQAALESACGDCPANATRSRNAAALAGCYGLVPLPTDDPQWLDTLEEAAARAGLLDQPVAHFPRTRPMWYGLWMSNPLAGAALDAVQRLLTALAATRRDWAPLFAELSAAATAALAADLRMWARVYPPGRVEGGWWRLVPHCPRCRAAWQRERCPGQCAVCGYEGHPAPDRKRRARGLRPYRPLEAALGPAGAAAFWLRYQAWQVPQRPADPAAAPPRPVPKNNPPAD